METKYSARFVHDVTLLGMTTCLSRGPTVICSWPKVMSHRQCPQRLYDILLPRCGRLRGATWWCVWRHEVLTVRFFWIHLNSDLGVLSQKWRRFWNRRLQNTCKAVRHLVSAHCTPWTAGGRVWTAPPPPSCMCRARLLEECTCTVQ